MAEKPLNKKKNEESPKKQKAEESTKNQVKDSADKIIKQEVTVDLSDDSLSSSIGNTEIIKTDQEESLEDFTDSASMREANSFSESQLASSRERKMPSATLSSSETRIEAQISQTDSVRQSLEINASSSIGENPGRERPTQGQEIQERVYSNKTPQEYFGKSYAAQDYRDMERDSRDRIRREEFATGPVLPTTNFVGPRLSEQKDDSRDWQKVYERESRDYVLDSISGKGGKKRIFRD